jgi:aminomethyltransferase
VISRTGWSAVPGFEVNLLDGTRGDALWQAIMDAGEEFAIRPIAPNEARRVEAGIFNWGSDISLGDTPFHVMGLERLVEDQPQDYIGKQALERVRREGVDRRLVGIEFDQAEPIEGITRPWPAHLDAKPIGRVTDAVWSPGLQKNIGYVWVPTELSEPGNTIDVESEFGSMRGRTATIPFVDPRKERPAQALQGTAGS